MPSISPQPSIAIVGGGPAGLMAAEVLSEHGIEVDLYDHMPSLGRKLLIAGRGGLNLTHAEPFTKFIQRYGVRSAPLEPIITEFNADAVRGWAQSLGIETFIGTSHRVFPTDFKAAPLLRVWLHRLRSRGVRIHVRHRWLGWGDEGTLRFNMPKGEIEVQHAATLFALGGGSWAKLGSDGAWLKIFQQRGIPTAPFRPSNCGFETRWTPYFVTHFGGHPLKSINISHTDSNGVMHQQQGDLVITDYGLEGGAIYALSTPLRDSIENNGTAELLIDLVPGRSEERLRNDLSKPRGRHTVARHLQRHTGLKGAKANLLREVLSTEQMNDIPLLARTIKALPIQLHATRPLDEAISTAGGVLFEALDAHLMLRDIPGVFCAGEMLDWDAPTGGYLLTASFATGRVAAQGIIHWLNTTARV